MIDQDEELTLANACADLVTETRFETFPRQLFETMRPGEWTSVIDLCRQAGVAPGDLTPDLFVTWLADPAGEDDYAVVMFFDSDSKWSMAAHYNRGRLFGVCSAGQVRRPTVAVPSSSTQ